MARKNKMQQYQDLIRKVLVDGCYKQDRTGVGTLSLFGPRMEFNLEHGFPLVTVKKTNFKAIIHELLWFLSGSTNIQYLNDNGVHIWDAWANEKGEIGPMYGQQFRHWKSCSGFGIDQIGELIDRLKQNPDSRRHKVTAWNVDDLPDEKLNAIENVNDGLMALAPCHGDFQCYVRYESGEKYLDMSMYQRSADVFLGLPFNIASYALLIHMIAQQCGFKVGRLIWNGGDTHIYVNHIDYAWELLNRDTFDLPKLRINRKPPSIFEYQYEDFYLFNYQYGKAIKAEVAI